MFNKYLLVITGVLLGVCILFYNLWDNTKAELKNIKEQKIVLEQELQRRNENEKNLSRRISELTRLYESHSDYSNTVVPARITEFLRKSCKACK